MSTINSFYKGILNEFGQEVFPQISFNSATSVSFSKAMSQKDLNNNIKAAEILGNVDTAPAALRKDIPSCKSEYTNTYTTFSGSDIVVYTDTSAPGEISGILFAMVNDTILKTAAIENYIDRYYVQKGYDTAIEITTTEFDRDPLGDNIGFLTICYANEYGRRAARIFRDLEKITKSSAYSVDSVFSQQKYIYVAKTMPDGGNMINGTHFGFINPASFEKGKELEGIRSKCQPILEKLRSGQHEDAGLMKFLDEIEAKLQEDTISVAPCWLLPVLEYEFSIKKGDEA